MTCAVLVRVVNQQATPVVEDVATSVTTPVNPLILSTVMSVCCSEPRGIDWDVGLSDMENSLTPATVTMTVTV